MPGDIRDAVKLYEILKPELLKRAIDHRCLNSNIKPYLTENEVLTYIEETSSESMDRLKALRNMEILTLSNPQWETSLYKIENDVINEIAIRGYVSCINDFNRSFILKLILFLG